MRIKKSVFALSLVLCLAIGAVGATAAGNLKEIRAYLNYGVTVKYNGQVQTMLDESGARVYPITYEGTTYLPVRAVAGMLGLPVNWDQTTQTVQLGPEEVGTDLINTFKPYTNYISDPKNSDAYYKAPVLFVQSDGETSASAGGVTMDHWLALRQTSRTNEPSPFCSFNLGGKYGELTFQVYAEADATLTVKGDNDSVLGQYSLMGGQVPQTIQVDIHGTTQLTLELVGAQAGTAMVATIFDAYLN